MTNEMLQYLSLAHSLQSVHLVHKSQLRDCGLLSASWAGLPEDKGKRAWYPTPRVWESSTREKIINKELRDWAEKVCASLGVTKGGFPCLCECGIGVSLIPHWLPMDSRACMSVSICRSVGIVVTTSK